jgi:receptor protein-tyrosine kinase
MSTIEKAMEKLGQQSPSLDSPNSSADDLAVEKGVPPEGAGTPDSAERSEDSVHRGPLVRLDRARLHSMGIVDPSADRNSYTAEQFRTIKRPLLMHAQGRGASIVEHPNLIMVTSSVAGEGKTFTSINLAMSVAMEMDKTVLLIDADVAKPEVTERLGVSAKAGLTDVLLDEDLGVSDVLVKTDIPNLSVLPAGRKYPRSTELLASDNMRRLSEELSTRYRDRIIIFDSPPLLVTSEARVLAELMGQIVLVVEESRTPQPVVREALEMINSCEIVGMVLNKSQRNMGPDYYGGYGYYGYEA